ncbi:HEPN domain protein [Thermovibrio ammonificans HB-1]|uniref:HEPN domain protein n=2 Tax=Thermovibrio ammonificans TaxID=228745 RepID=E8T4S8_THEA1|nr:HEPN domain protein [Thermovibrio ammonificans HB-1]
MMSNHFRWEELLNTAKFLLKVSNSPLSTSLGNRQACYRTVCNRCYYAVFKNLEDYFRKVGVLSENSSHKELLTYVKGHYPKLFTKLKRLQTLRIAADYDRKVQITEKKASKALKLGEALLSELKKSNLTP